ncbi:MAG: FkbM family methyltransferase [Armatimonadota bacterium]
MNHRIQPVVRRLKAIQNVGIASAVQYWLARRRRPNPNLGNGNGYETVTLTPRNARFPLYARIGSSDIEVYRQIFTEREYECIDDIKDVRRIIDCGANVGYASAYFLSRHPDASVIAIEPDMDNFALLQKNLASYGDRVHMIHAGVWSHDTDLSLRRTGEGNEWSISVEESGPNEHPDIRAIGLTEVFNRAGTDDIDILKIDIEGSEKIVFSQNYELWLPRTRNIVMELHGLECEVAVDLALKNRPHHKVHPNEELTVYRME